MTSDFPAPLYVVILNQIIHGDAEKIVPVTWMKPCRHAMLCFYPHNKTPEEIEELMRSRRIPEPNWEGFKVLLAWPTFDYQISLNVLEYVKTQRRNGAIKFPSEEKRFDVSFIEVKSNILSLDFGRAFDIEFKVVYKKLNQIKSDENGCKPLISATSKEDETFTIKFPIRTQSEFEKMDNEMFKDMLMQQTMICIFEQATNKCIEYDEALEILLDIVMTPSVQALYISGATPYKKENSRFRYFNDTKTCHLMISFIMYKYRTLNKLQELFEIVDEHLYSARMPIFK